MESVLGRYRNLIILVGVLFLQFLGLAMQVKRSTEPENTRLIRIWAVSAITPLERGLVWIQNGAGSLWHNYFYLRGVRAENRELKEQIEQMRLQQVRLSEDAAQAHRLQALLSFKEQFVAKTVAAQVIGTSGSDLSRIVYIDKGSDSGIRPDMSVITADGIVGKVWESYPSVSKVLLINDQSSGVGAILEKSRLQGVLRGTANGEVMLERIMNDEQVAPGETVLTSGGDRIFPKGLPVGIVSRVGSAKERKDLFLNIRIRPSADLSKLEEVLVVTEQQEREVAAQDTVRMRAADILAQRLPSVPDKPATPQGNNAGGNASASSIVSGGTSPTAKPAAKALTTGAQGTNATKAQNPPLTKPTVKRAPSTASPASAAGTTETLSKPNTASTLPPNTPAKPANDEAAPAAAPKNAVEPTPESAPPQPTPPQPNPPTSGGDSPN